MPKGLRSTDTSDDADELSRWVDLDRYPIDRPHDRKYRHAVEAAQRGLVRQECAHLPGFIRPEAVELMRREAEALSVDAVYHSQNHNPYFSRPPDDAPTWDPRLHSGRKTNGLIPGTAFDRNGIMWRLYQQPAMRRLVEDCLSISPLYFYEDPYGCLNVSIQRHGEEFAWHFDTNEFTVSVLVQQPDQGGAFQYAPNIRTPADERYRDVADVLAGTSSKIVSLDLRPGDLQLFKGRYSVHRVTPVAGPTSRLVALFAYARKPGMYATPERSQQIWGMVHPSQLGAATQHRRADDLVD